MDNQALTLNNTIEKVNTNVLEMLSERGKNIFFPKLGILAQSAQAKGKKINATIGEAVEDDGSSMHLPELDALLICQRQLFSLMHRVLVNLNYGRYGKILSIARIHH